MCYNDPHRWDFAFETHVHMTFAKVHSQPAKALLKVMERSIYSAHYCFCKYFHQRHRNHLFHRFESFLFYLSNILGDIEYELLKKWFEILTANDSCKIDHISMLLFITMYLSEDFLILSLFARHT